VAGTATGGNYNRAFARLRLATSIIAKAPYEGKVFAMANRMSTEKRNTILRLLVEGNSIRSVTRLMQTNSYDNCSGLGTIAGT